MFYILFHLWLNILAEVTHFGDREFYKVWPVRTCCTPWSRTELPAPLLGGLRLNGTAFTAGNLVIIMDGQPPESSHHWASI